MVNIPDDIEGFLKVQFLGTIFSAMIYGMVIILCGNCFRLLRKKRGIYSNRMRILLLIYVIFMLLLSTWSQIQSTFKNFVSIFPPQKTTWQFEFRNFPIAYVFTIWGADGFMIWRCAVLYQDMFKRPRLVVIVLLSLISFASCVFGIATLVNGVIWVPQLYYTYMVFNTFSALVNIILAVLIVLRLLYHQIHLRNALGAAHGSSYTNIITMCVESSSLMVIACGLYTVLVFRDRMNVRAFFFPVIPHICVISPLLIVYRVAIGHTIPSTLVPSEQDISQIRFNVPFPSPPFGQEGEA